MIDNETRNLLLRLADRYETPQFIVGDPSWWMHQVQDARNQEATAFVASVLSYGSRAQFMPKIGLLLDMADGAMDRWLRNGLYHKHFAEGDKGCFYRLYSQGTMRAFFDAYHQLMEHHGSLGEFVEQSGSNEGIKAVEAICSWFSKSGVSVVVPKDTASACKRVCMFLRWMVRSDSPVDLGLWRGFIDRRTLIMPLDIHVVSEAMKLNLLSSRCASMSAARRLTAAMSEIFPDDPLRGDFALFGYGVSTEPRD